MIANHTRAVRSSLLVLLLGAAVLFLVWTVGHMDRPLVHRVTPGLSE